MDYLWILVALSAALIANVVYWRLMTWITLAFPSITPFVIRSSWLILGLFFFELVFVISLGPIESVKALGKAVFNVLNLLVIVLSPPATLNLLVLTDGKSLLAKWYAAIPIGTGIAFILICLMLYMTPNEALIE